MANPNGTEVGDRQTDKDGPRAFRRQLAEKLPDIFTALFEAGTKERTQRRCPSSLIGPCRCARVFRSISRPDRCPTQPNAPEHSATSSQPSGEAS